MIAPDEAWAVILRSVRPLEVIPKKLDEAVGFCLAETVRADRDIPPADRSAMDGFAVRAADLAGFPQGLELVGEVAAGSAARPNVRSGTCVRILTGANLPPGADTVVMVEDTTEAKGLVLFSGSFRKGAHILRRGEDAKKGAVLVSKSTALGAMQIASCATVGKMIRVYRKPRIAIICTGTELRETGDRVKAHEVRNSNGPALAAALAGWGYHTAERKKVGDSKAGLRGTLLKSLSVCDVVLVTGGMSVGKYDFVHETLEAVGADIRFHGVAMKPGKPFLYAVTEKNTQIFGMPGHPLSAMTGFHEFVLPALRRMSGLPGKVCRPVIRLPLAARLESKGGRTRFALGHIEWKDSGPVVRPVHSQSSADVVAGAQADGAIILPAECSNLKVGALVDFRPWRALP
ncbi:MAG: gephyrin-like molybdotransferase Glp [bacterium]